MTDQWWSVVFHLAIWAGLLSSVAFAVCIVTGACVRWFEEMEEDADDD